MSQATADSANARLLNKQLNNQEIRRGYKKGPRLDHLQNTINVVENQKNSINLLFDKEIKNAKKTKNFSKVDKLAHKEYGFGGGPI